VAGGVAHDFNNMLMVIGGCSELLERSLRRSPARGWQVIMNLAVHSRDAMPEGGRLTVSTRNAQRLPEGGDSVESQTWVVLEVEDTGTGMDEQTRARIFEPFFTTKPDGKGTGLGLATVYGMVKQIGGDIHVESTAKANELPTVSATDSGIDATVLIADDEAALHAIVEILRSSDYKVLEAESSTQALEMARQHRGQLDILLTDIVMPGRGPELARRVAKVHPEVQIVYMSG
jgi:hypothetical protein